MTRVLSGIQPTGTLHLGNLLGAVQYWSQGQFDADSYFTIVDLHALTVEHSPTELRERVIALAAMLFASGIDPQVATVFVQSHVPAHSQLAWIMECTATFGELTRMTQFKDKGKGEEKVRAGLFTYPALMAADILLYQADQVPVGEDQKQHLELARDLATRFNHTFAPVFKIPTPQIPKEAARVMDLQAPDRKMSKSSSSEAGLIYLLDSNDVIARKILRAVTDTLGSVSFDPTDPQRSGVNNLLEIFSAITGEPPELIAQSYDGYGALKKDLAQAVISHIEPIRSSYQAYHADRAELFRLLDLGAERARHVASQTLDAAYDAVGLLPSGPPGSR